MELLVIEDDPQTGQALQAGFSEAGHACQWVQDSDRGKSLAQHQRVDVIMLDIRLSRVPGLEVLNSLRADGVQTPVVLLTNSATVDECVAGLNAGADDYVAKPVAFAELLARVTAVWRRTMSRTSTVLQSGDLTLNLISGRVTRGETEVDLTPTEYSLLELLMRHAGEIVTRKMLCDHLWKADRDGSTNAIEVLVHRLRGKLDDPLQDSRIRTYRGRGYVLRRP